MNWPNQVVVRVKDSTGQWVDSTGTIGGKAGAGGNGGSEQWSASAAIPNTAPAGGAASITATGNIVTPDTPPTTQQITSGSTTGTT